MNRLFFILILISLMISCKENDAVMSFNYSDLDISDDKAKNLFIEGMKEAQMENFSESKIFFEKANMIEKDNVIIINGLANSENILGEVAKAESLFQKSLKIDSSFVPTYVNYGNLLNEQKRFEESEEILLKGLSKNPTNDAKIGLYFNLALIMKKQNQCLLARQYAEKALDNCEYDDIHRKDVIDFVNEIKTNCE